MEYKKDWITRFILSDLGDSINDIDTYLTLTSKDFCVRFKTEEEIKNYFKETNLNITWSEADKLKSYTNLIYGRINALKHGTWDYEILGKLTEDDKKYYSEYANDLEKIIDKSFPLENNIVTYRGTNLGQFRSYGISSLQDLTCLLNQYMYNKAFISTSLLEERCFFKENKKAWEQNNIQIEYIIPKDSQDGLFLETSFYKDEVEYLLNCGSLVKVTDVKIDTQKEEAFIQMILVPKKVWYRNYLKEEQKHL